MQLIMLTKTVSCECKIYHCINLWSSFLECLWQWHTNCRTRSGHSLNHKRFKSFKFITKITDFNFQNLLNKEKKLMSFYLFVHYSRSHYLYTFFFIDTLYTSPCILALLVFSANQICTMRCIYCVFFFFFFGVTRCICLSCLIVRFLTIWKLNNTYKHLSLTLLHI